MAPAPRPVAGSVLVPARRLTNVHRHLSSSPHARLVQPRKPANDGNRDLAIGDSLPMGPETPPPTETSSPPLWMTEQIAPGPTDNAYRSGQSRGSGQSDGTPGDFMAAIVVALVILGGLLGLFIGGEMFRRAKRAKAAQGESNPSSPCWYERRKRRAPQSTPESASKPTEEYGNNSAYDEKTLTLDVAPVPRNRRDRRGRLSDVWMLQGLSACIQGFRKKSPRAPPNQLPTAPRPESPPPQMPTTWSGFSPIILSSPNSTTRKFLERIPEEPDEDDDRSQTRSEIAMALGTALQRSIDSSSVLSVAAATGSKSLLSMQGECCKRDEEPRENGAKTDQEATCLEPKSPGNCVPDMTLDDSAADTSSMSSQSIKTEAENPTEVFELKRVQTQSMQINKGVLLSFASKRNSNTDDDRGTAADPETGEFIELDGDAGSQLTLGNLTPTYTMIILDDFPSPPSVLPEISVAF